MAGKSSVSIKRFGIGRIVEHQANALVFTLLVITGLSQRFHEFKASHWVIRSDGGVDILRMVHRWCGVLSTLLIAIHITVGIYGIIKRRWPGAMMVNLNDFLNAMENMRAKRLALSS